MSRKNFAMAFVAGLLGIILSCVLAKLVGLPLWTEGTFGTLLLVAYVMTIYRLLEAVDRRLAWRF